MEFNEKQFEEKFVKACLDFVNRFIQHNDIHYSMTLMDDKIEYVKKDEKGNLSKRDDSKIEIKVYVVLLDKYIINRQLCLTTTKNKLDFDFIEKHVKNCIQHSLIDDLEIEDYVISFEYVDNNLEDY